MARTITNDQAAAAESESSGPGLIPRGTRVRATVVPTRKDTPGKIEERPYAKSGANAGRPSLNVQFRIADGQKYANRRLFANIPLFVRFAPTQKNPQGAPAKILFDFARALGVPVVGENIELPDDTVILGSEVEIVVGVEDADDRNPDGRNTVAFINPVTATSGTSASSGPTTQPAGQAWDPAADVAAAANVWGAPTTPAASPDLQAAAAGGKAF